MFSGISKVYHSSKFCSYLLPTATKLDLVEGAMSKTISYLHRGLSAWSPVFSHSSSFSDTSFWKLVKLRTLNGRFFVSWWVYVKVIFLF